MTLNGLIHSTRNNGTIIVAVHWKCVRTSLDGDSCSNLTASYLGNKSCFEADKRMITLNCVLRPRLHVSNGRQPILVSPPPAWVHSTRTRAIQSFIALAWGGHDLVHNVRIVPPNPRGDDNTEKYCHLLLDWGVQYGSITKALNSADWIDTLRVNEAKTLKIGTLKYE